MTKAPKPEHESQWFMKNERELLASAKLEREKRTQQREAEESAKALEALKAAHWMKCPKCGHDMKIKVVEDIELDECTFCEGIFFDRGELESFMMRKTDQRFQFFRSIFGLD